MVNCGSSSLKYTFYDTEDDTRHVRGQVERIGLDGTRHVHRGSKGEPPVPSATRACWLAIHLP